MAFLRTAERRFLEALARLNYCNPFLPERIECERDVLGDAFHPAPRVWSNSAELTNDRENVKRLAAEVERLAAELHDRLAQGAKPTVAEVALYEDLILYLLYDRYRAKLGTTTDEINASAGTMPKITYWKKFLADYQHFLSPADRQLADVTQAAHCSPACFNCGASFSTSSITLWASRSQRPSYARPFGNPSSPTTCAVTGACCTTGWAI